MFNTLLRQVFNHYPFLTPRASLLKLLPETPRDYGPFRISDGLQIAAYPQESADHVVKSLFWFGSFDPWVCHTLKSLASPGSTVLDIGANIGLMSLMMAHAVGEHGQVHAFEPAPDTCERLRQNVAANEAKVITTHEVALSNHVGTCQLIVPNDQHGMARISDKHAGETTFQIPMTTFDQWTQDYPLSAVSVCKIDVEGHEPRVLKGMQNSLSQRLIDCIVFEDHAAPEASETQAILKGHGFRIFRMFKRIRSVRYSEIGTPCCGTPTADYVAVLPRTCAERVIEQGGA